MNSNYIKYPVALNHINRDIVPIDEVTNDNRVSLSCPICKDKFIAVLKHQTPHFKHKPHTNCSGSVETYIHWLAKEVFKDLREFEIPELLIDDLPEKQRQNFQLNFNKVLDLNVPPTFRGEFKKGLKSNLTDSRNLLIDTVETEKEYKTNLGNVRIDVVATVEGEEVFIEPFFSNTINDKKKEKLALIKKPTMSLNLLIFVNNFYSIHSLRKYLISKKSKKWIFLTNEEYSKHSENYQDYLLDEVKRNKVLIDVHNSKLQKISTLEQECLRRDKKIDDLREEISEIRKEIFSLKKELGIYY